MSTRSRRSRPRRSGRHAPCRRRSAGPWPALRSGRMVGVAMASIEGRVPVIELIKVSKTFGEVRSLAQVDFAVYPGEIVGLLGDNGAGKSTLVKIITGYHQPDGGGLILVDGERVAGLTVAKARKLGIET